MKPFNKHDYKMNIKTINKQYVGHNKQISPV